MSSYSEVACVCNKTQANKLREKLIEETLAAPAHASKSREEVWEMVNHNIGYQAGYHDERQFRRILRLFNVEHPLYGYNLPDATTAFKAGQILGKLTSEGKSVQEAMIHARSFLGTDTRHETVAKLMKLKEKEEAKQNGKPTKPASQNPSGS